MNKPPIKQTDSEIKDTYIFDGTIRDYRAATEAEKQMCEQMKRPMTQKTENLTTQEAWAAMAKGECVRAEFRIYKIAGSTLLQWSKTLSSWMDATNIGSGPYSIVPDPSKPKEVEDEYAKDKQSLIKGSFVGEALRIAIVDFVERNFEKRKP